MAEDYGALFDSISGGDGSPPTAQPPAQDYGKLFDALSQESESSLVSKAAESVKELGQSAVAATIGSISTVRGAEALIAGKVLPDSIGKPLVSSKLNEVRQLEGLATQYKPAVSRIEDVGSGYDLARYFAYGLGQVLPSMGEALITGAAGFAAGSAVPGPGNVAGGVAGVLGKQAAKQLLKKGVENLVKAESQALVKSQLTRIAAGEVVEGGLSAEARNILTQQASKIGGTAGAALTGGVSSWTQNTGETYNELISQGVEQNKAENIALVVGSAKAIPDTVLGSYVVSRFFPGVKSVARAEASKAGNFFARFLVNLGKEGLITVPAEGSTEALQEYMDVAAGRFASGESVNPADLSKDERSRILNAGVIGAVGGVAGGGAAAVGATINQRTTNEKTTQEEGQAPPKIQQAESKAESSSQLPDEVGIGLASRIAGLTGEQFVQGAQRGGPYAGFTQLAYSVGQALTSPAEVQQLREYEARAEAQSRDAIASGNAGALSGYSAKKQFFSEAIGAATGTGSAGERLKVEQPGYQPRFPQEPAVPKPAKSVAPKYLNPPQIETPQQDRVFKAIDRSLASIYESISGLKIRQVQFVEATEGPTIYTQPSDGGFDTVYVDLKRLSIETAQATDTQLDAYLNKNTEEEVVHNAGGVVLHDDYLKLPAEQRKAPTFRQYYEQRHEDMFSDMTTEQKAAVINTYHSNLSAAQVDRLTETHEGRVGLAAEFARMIVQQRRSGSTTESTVLGPKIIAFLESVLAKIESLIKLAKGGLTRNSLIEHALAIESLLDEQQPRQVPETQPVMEEQRKVGGLTPTFESFQEQTALAQNPEQLQETILSAGSQNLSIKELVDAVAARTNASPQAQRLLGVDKMDAVLGQVGRYLNPQNWYGIKQFLSQTNAPIGVLNQFAIDQSQRLRLFVGRIDRIRKSHLNKLNYIKSEAFKRRMLRRDMAALALQSTDQARVMFENNVKTAIAAAEKSLREESITQGNIEAREQELKGLRNLAGLGNGTAALLRQMADALSLDPTGQGLQLLWNGGTAEQFYRAYTGIARASGTILSATQKQLVTFASHVLARDRTLDRQMVGLALIQNNSAVRAGLTKIQSDLVTQLQNNPLLAAQRILNKIEGLATDEQKAYAAFVALNQETMRELKRLNELADAVSLGDALLADNDFRNLQFDVQKTIGGMTMPLDKDGNESQVPFILAGRIRPVLPDGTVVEINMAADKAEMEQEQLKLNDVAQAYADWLNDPANDNSIHRGTYQVQLDYINSLYRTSITRQVPKIYSLFHNTMMAQNWQMIEFVLKEIGTPASRISLVAAENWGQMQETLQAWMRKNISEFRARMARAARAHGFQAVFNEYEGSDGVTEWYNQIGNELFARHQETGGAMFVGQPLDSGHIIMQEDIDILRLQSRMASDAFRISLEKIVPKIGIDARVKDKLNGVADILRKALERGPMMLPRVFSEKGKEFARLYHSLDKAGKRALLDQNFDQVVMSFLSDRSQDFSPQNPHAPIYKQAADMIRARNEQLIKNPSANPTLNAPTNLDELIDWIDSQTWGMGLLDTKDQAENYLLGEMDRILENFYKLVAKEKDDPTLTIQSLDQRNPFTASRERRLAPYYFYDTGFKDDASVINFRDAGGAFHFKVMLISLQSTLEDLREHSLEFNRRLGGKINEARERRRVVGEQNKEIALGKTYVDFDGLQNRINELNRLIDDLLKAYVVGGHSAVLELAKMRQVADSITSNALASAFVSIGNMFGGTATNGQILSRIEGSVLRGFGKAIKHFIGGSLQVMGTGVISIKEAAKLFGDGKFADALYELHNGPFERLKMYRRLADYGFGMPLSLGYQFEADMSLLTSGGGIAHRKYPDQPIARIIQKALYGGLTFLDSVGNIVFEPLKPRFIDMKINNDAANSAVQLIGDIEAKLRDIYAKYSNAGIQRFNLADPFDSTNWITADEYFGSGGNNNSFYAMIDWFGFSRVPFQESVIDFYQRLEAASPQDRRNVRFLMDEQVNMLALNHANEVNKATPLNRSVFMIKNVNVNLILKLKGWSFNAIRKNLRYYGRAADDPKASASRLMLGQLAFTVLATSAMALVYYDAPEILKRIWARYMRGEERATKQWWEREGWAGKMAGIAISLGSTYPFISDAISWSFSDQPNKPSIVNAPFLVNKAKALLGWMAGMVQTGDVTYGFERIAKNLVPESAIIINRLPGTRGTSQVFDTRKLEYRYGPADLLKNKGGAGDIPKSTPLSPLREQMVNAIGKGDIAEFMRLRQETIAKARLIGEKEPERLVDKLWMSASPERAVFKERLTPLQDRAMLMRMSDYERAEVLETRRNFQRAAGAAGVSLQVTDDDRPASGGSAGVPTALPFRSSGSAQAGVPTSLPGQGAVRQAAIGAGGRISAAGIPSGRGRIRSSIRRPRVKRIRAGRIRKRRIGSAINRRRIRL